MIAVRLQGSNRDRRLFKGNNVQMVWTEFFSLPKLLALSGILFKIMQEFRHPTMSAKKTAEIS
jgi:hypothetical protein